MKLLIGAAIGATAVIGAAVGLAAWEAWYWSPPKRTPYERYRRGEITRAEWGATLPEFTR